jgi:hypothetical protein
MIRKTITILSALIILSQHIYAADLRACTLENMSIIPFAQRDKGNQELRTRILHAKGIFVPRKVQLLTEKYEYTPEEEEQINVELANAHTQEMNKRYAAIYPLAHVARKLQSHGNPQAILLHIADFLTPRGTPIRILEDYEKGKSGNPDSYKRYFTSNKYTEETEFSEGGCLEIKFWEKDDQGDVTMAPGYIPAGAFRTYQPFCIGSVYQIRFGSYFHEAVNGVFRNKGY